MKIDIKGITFEVQDYDGGDLPTWVDRETRLAIDRIGTSERVRLELIAAQHRSDARTIVGQAIAQEIARMDAAARELAATETSKT